MRIFGLFFTVLFPLASLGGSPKVCPAMDQGLNPSCQLHKNSVDTSIRQNLVILCQNKFQENRCDQLKAPPENLLDCQEKSVCENLSIDLGEILSSCQEGFYKFGQESYQEFKKTLQTIASNFEDQQKCNEDLTRKKFIYQQFNSRVPPILNKNVPEDSALSAMTCYEVELQIHQAYLSQMQQADRLLRAFESGNPGKKNQLESYPVELKAYKIWMDSETEKQAKNIRDGLIALQKTPELIHKILTDLQIKLDCYKNTVKTEIVCKTIAPQIIQMAFGALSTGGVYLHDLYRLTHSEKVLEQLHSRSPVRLARRQDFIKKHLNQEFTTEAQNQRWIELANIVSPDGKTKFFEVENSVMKNLNDTTQDKNLVTAITNKHKELLQTQMKKFEAVNPGVEILPYNDFKAMRFALRPKPPATDLPPDIQQKFNEIFQNTNKEFESFLQNQNLVRAADKPKEWFRAGFGETADQATLASRFSRNIAGENKIRNFSDRNLQSDLGSLLHFNENFRHDLEKEFSKTKAMETLSGTDKVIFKKEVFEAIRKSETDEDLKAFLDKTYDLKISDDQASRIRTYGTMVDEFSPGIHVAKRNVASLSDSPHGGLSIDFVGLGALNLKETAAALIRSNNLEEAVKQTRLSERSVSQMFAKQKSNVKESIQLVLEKHNLTAEIIDSGDDMVVKPNKPLPLKVRQEIAEKLSASSGSSVRISHVPDKVVNESSRMVIGTHGETIEKLTRKNLLGEIPKEKLDQVLLMVDMRTTSSGQGPVQLLLGTGKSQLTDPEKKKIKKAFDQAITEINSKLIKENQPGNYSAD